MTKLNSTSSTENDWDIVHSSSGDIRTVIKELESVAFNPLAAGVVDILTNQEAQNI